jgi:hypothetical protein
MMRGLLDEELLSRKHEAESKKQKAKSRKQKAIEADD